LAAVEAFRKGIYAVSENDMRIDRFKLRDGYGYLNLEVKFRPRMTFLTGINGSGKTSVVRGLVALLGPSFSTLANTAYTRMSVDVDIESVSRTIEAVRGSDSVSINISGIDDVLEIPIFKQTEYEPPHRFAERESEYYREFHTSVSSHVVVKFLSSLPTPMFLDLERRYQGPRIRRGYRPAYEDNFPRNSKSVFGGSLAEGLSEAVELAEDSYREVLARQQAQMNKLRRDLILTAFTSVERSPFLQDGINLPDQFAAESGLRKQRQVVSETLKAIEITDSTIDKFFDDVDATLQMLAGKELDSLLKDQSGQKIITEWVRVQPQLAQINRSVEIVEKHNDRIKKAYAEIDKFLELINVFLVDGGKRLEFAANGRLKVYYGDTLLKGIAGLSSGERQLVVILTHLAFNRTAKQANVLIIDEPELSLHVKWQEMFVTALEKANPDIQFILATHSPSIILGRTVDCVDVRGELQ